MRKYKLRELLTIKNGCDYRHLSTGSVPVYGSGGFMCFVNQAVSNKPSILLPRKGTLNNIMFIDKPFWTVDTMYWSEIKEDIVEPYYLYNYLKVLKFDGIRTGSTLPSMTSSAYYDIPVILPDYNKQTRVANILKLLNNKIELNNKINQELEQMAKIIYDYWFVQFDFPDEKGRPYKSANRKMVYNEVLKREIPIGWEVKSLYDIATYINGLACQKFRPTDENSYNVIKIKELHTGFNEETEKVKKNIPSKYLVNDGDILFSWSATLEIHMWTGGTGVLNQHIFNVKSKEYPKSFCYYLLNEYVKVFKKIAETRKTTMGHITIDHLKQAYVLVPPLCLINALDNRIKPIFDSIITHRKEQQSLANIRDFLLPLLMNGQVTVSPEH